MLDLEFSEKQKMLRRTARDFLTANCPEAHVRQMEFSEKNYSPELWHKIAGLGWLGVMFPEKYGGSGGDILDAVVLQQEMGRVLFPSPFLSTILCGLTLLAAGNDYQKAKFLPEIAKGDLIAALALTEPSASWDVDGVTVSAAAVSPDEYVINGTKLFVYDAQIADYLLCVTRTKNGAAPEEGITLFWVDAKSAGINCSLLRTIAGDKPSEVIFNGVRVPKKNVIGELDNGWVPLAETLQQGVVLLCAQMLGMGEFILERSVDYAKTRITFDRPLGTNQWIQGYCVDILAQVEGIRWATYKAAFKLSHGLPAEYDVSLAKAWSSDALEQACLSAHGVWGGHGFMLDYGFLPLYSRRVKAVQLYLGDSTYHRKKIAQHMDNWVLERPKGEPLGFWNEADYGQGALWTPNVYDHTKGA